MSNIAIHSSFKHTCYLFAQSFCNYLPIVYKVATIAFHIFTLCIPLALYHAISYCRSKLIHSRHLKKKQNVLFKYLQNKFQYIDTPQRPIDTLFELQKTITLPKGTVTFEVDMFDEGRVEQVSNKPVFLYTDYLGPCVAAIGKCKVSDSSMLIGVTHLYTDNNDFRIKNGQEMQFKPHKLRRLIDQFLSHSSYKGQEIELFFAGGNGSEYATFWREKIVEYTEKIPKVRVVGKYFIPYRDTPTVRKKLKADKIPLSFLAGITNQGSILLHKSHDIDFNFQESNFDSLFG